METENGSAQENRYDVENLRFELLENGKRTCFVYHNGELLHEEGGNKQTGYHLGSGIEAFSRGQEIYYYQQDEQLSTAFITERSGTVHNSYQYDAFGNELETVGRLPNRIRYTAQQYDYVTGQYYLRARYYNPILGRFMQEDTYQDDGLNLYAYCKKNPMVYYDPSGYADILCDTPQNGGGGGSGYNGIYEKADYHGKKNNSVKNKAPNKGQEALDNSVSIGPNTTRRVGISDGEIVVLDKTTSGKFHGHVRSWNELSEQMKAVLRKEGMVNKKGKIIK